MLHPKIISYAKTVENNQEVSEIIGDKLSKEETSLILQVYQQRLLKEKGFNKENFILDLKGYLKYLALEEKNDHYSYSSIVKTFFSPLRLTVREKLLQHYDYSPATPFGESGHAKMSYLAINKNEIIRFYYAYPTNFFYSKLMGTSETDINKAIGNDLLTVYSVNIPGEPMDVMERALPLSDVFDWLEESSNDRIISEIEEVKKTNPLITEFIEGTEENIGLVVRLDRQGRKRVYVVAFDLDLRIARQNSQKSDQEIISLFRQQKFSRLRPKSFDYNYLVEFIPELNYLSTKFIAP